MTECEERVTDWLKVTDQSVWGSADPLGLVDGGKEGLSKKLCDVTSDVKMFPADGEPYGSHLVGRLAARADISATNITHLGVFVEMDKGHAHVKMWKAGLEASLEEINGADEAKKSSKALKPSDERDLVEKTGMGWVEQVVLRAAMAMGIMLSREQAQ